MFFIMLCMFLWHATDLICSQADDSWRVTFLKAYIAHYNQHKNNFNNATTTTTEESKHSSLCAVLRDSFEQVKIKAMEEEQVVAHKITLELEHFIALVDTERTIAIQRIENGMALLQNPWVNFLPDQAKAKLFIKGFVSAHDTRMQTRSIKKNDSCALASYQTNF